MIVRRDQGPSGQWFDANMRYLVGEAVRGRPGTSCMMARLTELLFIEMLRLNMAKLRDEDVGWLAALNDRHTCRALNLFHSRPADPWTVEVLAREVGLSRSALVRRFDRLLDMSPIRYLTTWRFHLAAQVLREGSDQVATVADRVGYESEEGFSRALKRYFGVAPAAWRQSQAS
jgi:AraC-like DNA-binding protein